MWWLIVPALIGAGKVIYDVVTDDSSSSSSSSSYSKLPSQKNKRTTVRKTAINQLLSMHRNRIKAQLEVVIKKESYYVGEVMLDLSNDTTYKVKFTDLDKAISCLNMANDIVLGRGITNSNSVSSLQLITLKSNSSLIDEIVQKADSDYGSLAGIDSYDDYVESQDPFLNTLKKAIVRTVF
ncbi:MAG: hypothetical protein QX189_03440 [Methylococcales bacterium]